MIETCFHRSYHLGPDLVTTGANARTEASYDVGGAAAVGFHHSRSRLRSDPPDGALPAGVGQANSPADGVIEQNGQAIGEAEHEGDAGGIGDQGIGGRDHSTAILRPDQGHPAPVHLVGSGDIPSRDAQGLIDEVVIGLHCLVAVADEVAHIEGIERRGAHSTQPREYAMKDLIMRGQISETVVDKVIDLMS